MNRLGGTWTRLIVAFHKVVHFRKGVGKMRLHTMAFALSCALMWGLGLFALTWWIIAFEGSSDTPTMIGRIYRGYSITPAGSLIGLAWALVDGFFGGLIFAWLYNLLLGKKAIKRQA